MSTPKLIIMSGKKGSGKDTVADHLVAKHGYVKIAFADELKSMLRRINPIVGYNLATSGTGDNGDKITIKAVPIRLNGALSLCYNDELVLKKKYPEYRNLMQKLGTNGIREIEPDFWVKHTVKKADALIESGFKVVITDARFDNEAIAAQAITDDSIGIMVNRESLTDDAHSNHESERGISEKVLKSIFTSIDNNGTYDELYSKVDTLLD